MKAFIITALIIVLIIWIAQLPATSSEALKPYQDQVANDFVDQYDMAKKHGTLMDRCVRAQLVAEGYLQAENQEQYAHWKGVQSADCKKAGVGF